MTGTCASMAMRSRTLISRPNARPWAGLPQQSRSVLREVHVVVLAGHIPVAGLSASCGQPLSHPLLSSGLLQLARSNA